MKLRILAAALAITAAAVAAGDPVRMTQNPIYPAGGPRVKFSHETPVHAAQNCLACHKSAASSARPGDNLRPNHNECAACHAIGATTPPAQPTQCRFCHTQFTDESSATPIIKSWPVASLKFSHQLHEAKGFTCNQCHNAGASGSMALPSMETCTVCHVQSGATTRCAACHLTKPDGRLETSLPGGKLMPSGAMGTGNHTGDFRRNHTTAARANASTCDACHTPQECMQCHAGSIKPREIHPNDWILLHPAAARLDPTQCVSCHRQQSFCLSCHEQAGMSQSSLVRPQSLRLHPRGWAALRGQASANLHATEAQRNINQCVSCHREADCLRCHASSERMPSAGVSPHPTGFRAACGKIVRQNARACVKCHTAVDSLCK